MTETEIYQRHVRTIYGFFIAKTFNRALAEDLTSDVFVTAFEQYRNPQASIDDREKYLYGVMRITWTQYLRGKYQNLEDPTDEIEDFASYVESELQATAERSLIDRALPYIEQLSPAQQAVLLPRFRDGRNLSEICTILGKDMNYVKTTQKRGLAALRKLVESGEVQV